jgi:diaminohydroxyphosphoribosylaminopyrimidine deaminase / 5-amino-6-(5-phosphoribosylamino)uracil reductase
VLARDGVEIARAVTQPGGRPHAETEALRLAGAAARGATLYVTLEPCSHVGKTGPCAEAVIATGVARVVVGIEDPDPRVAGRGLAMLRAADVEVVVGVEAKACRWVTLGHILRVTERRPMVLIKMALRDDLTVPTGHAGQPEFVTSPEARAMGHRFRAKSDAILVGAGTVRDDNPALTCRVPGLEHRSPIRVVLDGMLSALTPATKLAQTARDVPVWVLTTTDAPLERREALEAMGVRVMVRDAVNSRPQLTDAMRVLADEGITRLMVEGGRTIWEAFAGRRLLDEAIVFVPWTETAAGHLGMVPAHQPMTVTRLGRWLRGTDGPKPPSVSFERISRFPSTPSMALFDHGEIGGDKWFRFQRVGT